MLYDEVDTAAPGYRKWTIIRAAKEECEGKKLFVIDVYITDIVGDELFGKSL